MTIEWVCQSCGCSGGSWIREGYTREEGEIAAMRHHSLSPECKEPRIAVRESEGPA